MSRPLRFLRASAAALLLAVPAAGQVFEDDVQHLDFDAPESWAMKYFTSVALFTGLGAPDEIAPGEVVLTLEAAHVPQLSEAERTVGFGGTKAEDLNKTEVFGRPSALVGLPADWSLEGSYLPPVDLFGVEPELASLAVARPLWRGEAARLGLRLIGQYGRFTGDFTCSAEEVASGPNPLGCEAPSRDTMTLRSATLALVGALRLGRDGRFEPHLGIAVTRMDLDFRVGARYSGIVDRSKLLTDGETLALTAGLGYRLNERWTLAGEVFYSPLDVVRPPATRAENDALLNARAALRYALR